MYTSSSALLILFYNYAVLLCNVKSGVKVVYRVCSGVFLKLYYIWAMNFSRGFHLRKCWKGFDDCSVSAPINTSIFLPLCTTILPMLCN
jgi:hypothetical protein